MRVKLSGIQPYQVAGLCAALIGFVVAIAWIFRSAALYALLPGAAEMAFNGPLLLLAAGVCLCLLPRRRHEAAVNPRAIRFICLLLLALPALILAEHLSGSSFGIDWHHAGVLPTPANPHPGRVSPNASLAFLLVGVSLAGLTAKTRRRRIFRVVSAAACVALVISLAGLAGYVLHFEVLYHVSSFGRMLPLTALGLALLAGGALLYLQQLADQEQAVENYRERIAQRAVVILTLLLFGAGLAGFSVMRHAYEHSLADSMRMTAVSNAAVIEQSIQSSLWFARVVAGRPNVVQAYLDFADARKHGKSDDGVRYLAGAARNLLSTGLTSIRFTNAAGAVLAQAGDSAEDTAVVRHPLADAGQEATLYWSKAYVLRAVTRVTGEASATTLGYVITEQPLTAVDLALAKIRSASASSDVLLCGRDGDDALCAPTRFYHQVFRIPMRKPDGTVNFPINQALLGESGVRDTPDLRGVPVMASYMPLAPFGLALVIKSDLDTLYTSLGRGLLVLAALLTALALLGRYALAVQIQPLVNHIVHEQKRTQVILQNSNDAFVAIDGRGGIVDWNAQAEKTFGWAKQEVLGRPLPEVLIPSEMRAAHQAGFERFTRDGDGPIVNRRIKVTALHKDGRELPVEMSVGVHHDGSGYVASAFLHDISERLAAEEKVATSERRLRTVTDNLPVLISYINKERRIEFANRTFREWWGIDPGELLGKTVEQGFPGELELQRREHIDRALEGYREEFQVESNVMGRARHLQSIYLPDQREDSTVAGIYTLTMDITALKHKERQLAHMARYDALTGLPNRYLFNEKLIEAMHRCRRSRAPMAVMYLDIDRFKHINDTLGHGAGDEVLKEFAVRVKGCVRVTDTAARLAGDEFVVILEGLNTAEVPQFVARKVIAAVTKPMAIDQAVLEISTSIGIAFFRGEDVSADELLERADRALYHAKENGRNRYELEAG